MRDQLQVQKLRTEDVGVLSKHFRSELDRTHHSDLFDQDAGQFSFYVAWAGDAFHDPLSGAPTWTRVGILSP